MAKFIVPTDVRIHSSRAFLENNNFFNNPDEIASLELNPNFMHIEPMGLAMIAAWGAWNKRNGNNIVINNITRFANYSARMKLFETLGSEYTPQINEHEETGHFLPLRNIRTQTDIQNVIADVSALLHLVDNPDSLQAVQYCLSELLRNVIEHSGSPDGAFVCANNYSGKGPHRVTLAVADCGCGISAHLGRIHSEIQNDDLGAIRLAMEPGVTGAIPGEYGTSDNAGVGLYFTRCIAKGTGGYFQVISGNAAYRLLRAKTEDQTLLFTDPFLERSNKWSFPNSWQGTVVTMEIKTEMINEFESYFGWIREKIPARRNSQKRVRFS